ncbi:hypothetical protein HUG17_9563 [Dermatophagoides farinae]|uniref:Uncharacterized protein n=1 Tax=Dermatophagoides farinae TaxID=6954 RepID=A0A9D4P2K2_DERFA|nr:hypothetical protein HUG17_9563 [Dermatophagoides farinae]
MSSASTTNQQVRKPLVDRFSYLLRKCSSSTSTTTKAFPIINRRTLIGSGIAANLRIRDPANVDMIQAEIYQFHDPNTGEKSNELKPISMTKPTFVNDQEIFGDTLLKHMDRITFGTTTTTATEMKRHDFIFEIHKIQHSTTSTSTPRTTATMKSPSSSSSTSLISLNKSLTRNGTKSKMIQKQQQQKLELRVETLRKNHLVATTSLKASEIVNMKQQQQQHRPKQLSLNENLTTNSSNQQVTNNAMNNDDKWQYHDDQQVQEQQQQSSLMMDQSSKTMLSSFNERFYSESMPSIFVMATPSSIISTPFSQHNKRKWSTTTTTTAGHFDIDPSDDNETPKKSDQCNNNRLLPMSLLTLNLNLTPTTIDHERKTNLTTFKQQQQQQQRIRIMDQTGVLGLGQKQREIVVKAHETNDGIFEIQINDVIDERITKPSFPSTSTIDNKQQHEQDNSNNVIINNDDDEEDPKTIKTLETKSIESLIENECQSPIITAENCHRRRSSNSFQLQIEPIEEIDTQPSTNDDDDEQQQQTSESIDLYENEEEKEVDDEEDDQKLEPRIEIVQDSQNSFDSETEEEDEEQQVVEEFYRKRSKSLDLITTTTTTNMYNELVSFHQHQNDDKLNVMMSTKSCSSLSSSSPKQKQHFSIYTGLIRQLFQPKTPVADYVTYVDQLVEMFDITAKKKIIKKRKNNIGEEKQPQEKTIQKYNLRKRVVNTKIFDSKLASQIKSLSLLVKTTLETSSPAKKESSSQAKDVEIVKIMNKRKKQTKKMKMKKRKIKAPKRNRMIEENSESSSSSESLSNASIKKQQLPTTISITSSIIKKGRNKKSVAKKMKKKMKNKTTIIVEPQQGDEEEISKKLMINNKKKKKVNNRKILNNNNNNNRPNDVVKTSSSSASA